MWSADKTGTHFKKKRRGAIYADLFYRSFLYQPIKFDRSHNNKNEQLYRFWTNISVAEFLYDKNWHKMDRSNFPFNSLSDGCGQQTQLLHSLSKSGTDRTRGKFLK